MSGCSINNKENKEYKSKYEGIFDTYFMRYVWDKNGELPLDKTRIGGEVVDSQLYKDILNSEYAKGDERKALELMSRTFTTNFESTYERNEDGQHTLDQVVDYISKKEYEKAKIKERRLAEINTPSSYTINFPEATVFGKTTRIFYTREQGIQIFRTLELYGGLLNNWSAVKAKLEEAKLETLERIQKGKRKEGDDFKLINLIAITENFELFKDWYSKQEDRVSIETEDPDIQDSVTALTKDKDISQQRRASKKVVRMVASLPSYRKVLAGEINPETNQPYEIDNYVLEINSVLGLPMSGNFSSNWNLLSAQLSGTQRYEDMYQKVIKLGDVRPQFKELAAQMVDPTLPASTIDGANFVNMMALRSIMSNPEVKHFVVNQETKQDGAVVVTVQQKGKRNLRNPIAMYDRTYFAFQSDRYKAVDTDGNDYVNIENIYNDFNDFFTRLGAHLARKDKNGKRYEAITFFTKDNIQEGNRFLKAIGLGLSNTDFQKEANRPGLTEFYGIEASKLKAIFEKLKIVHGLNTLAENDAQTIKVRNILDFIHNPVSEILGVKGVLSDDTKIKIGVLAQNKFITYQADKIETNIKNYLGKKSTELKGILEYFDSFESEFYSTSYLTAEDKKKFGRTSWFYLTQTTSAVNSAENYEELINTPGFERFDYRKNPDMLGSIWLNRLFGLPLTKAEIEKNALSTYTKTKIPSLGGINNAIDIFDFGGMEVKQGGNKKGFHTTNLHPEDKMMQDIFSFFQTGNVENIRFGDKTSSFSTMFTNAALADRVYIPFNYDNIVDPKEDIAVEEQLVNIFNNYLVSEFGRVISILEEQEGTPKSTYQKLGKKLFIFKDILSQELLDKISNASSVEELRVLYGEAKSQLPAGLKAYFDKQADKLVNMIVDTYTQEISLQTGLPLSAEERLNATANILNKHNFISLQILPIDVRNALRALDKTKIDINAQNLKYIASYYVKNGFINNVEFLKFFVGDIANFDKTGAGNFREIFKRIPFTSTPGNPPMWSSFVEDFFKFDSNRDALSVEIGGVEREFTDKVRVGIYKDVIPFTKEDWNTYKEAYYSNKDWSELGVDEATANYFEAYTDNPKEADGQGVVTLDFYRNYLISIGRWDWDIQEPAFNQQVTFMQKVNQYNQSPTPELKKEIEDFKINNTSPFPPLKLGYFGSIVEDVKRNALHKFSLVPLIPSAIQGTQMMDQLKIMYKNQIDYYTFRSGSKMADYGEAGEFYVEKEVDGQKVLVPNPEAGVDNVTTLYLQNLREQQYQAPKFKGNSTLSTQMVKLIFGDFFEYGEINQSLTPETQEKIPGLYDRFTKNIEDIVKFEQLKLERKLGISRNAAGDIVSVNQLQMARFLTSELDKKEGSDVLRKYIQVDANGNFVNPLDGVNQRDKIESIILSVINNRIIKQKVNGESYIQVAGTGFEAKRFSKPTAKQLREYGAAGLKFYSVDENGINQPMEVKVGFNPKKHAGLLNLKFGGVKIGNLDKLNDILLGDTEAKKQWIKEHKDKITMVGVRIPVQGPQSMEYVQVKEFLPQSAGPIMILPAQIVTKSGGDYDIDKLTFFETALDEEGNVVQSSISVANYEQALSNQKELQSRKIRLKNLKEAVEKEVSANPSYQDREALRTELKEISKNINEAIANIDEYLDDPNSIYSGNFTREELIQEFKGDIYQKVAALSSFDAVNNFTAQIKFLKDINEEIKNIINESTELSNIINYKKALTNNLVGTIRDLMSLPEWYGKSTEPNNNDVFNKYTPKGTMISSTDVFNPLTSWQIFRENILSKDALGIDAKINTMQKEFQIAGLRYVSPFLNAYYFKANRNADNQILLGGTTDANGEHKISKVLSEFINGHVDIAREDWIILLGLDENTSPLAHAMILTGTPVQDVLNFIKSDIISTVRKASDKGALYQNFNKGLSAREVIIKLTQAKLRQLEGTEYSKLIKSAEAVIDARRKKDGYAPSDSFVLSTYVNILLKSDLFNKHLSSFEPSRVIDNQKEKLVRDIAYMLQFGVVIRQQERLRELTSNADFNTDNIRTSYTASIRAGKKAELTQDFNSEAIEFMFKKSALSGFNSNGFTQEILAQVFPLTESNDVNTAIGNYIKAFGIFKDEEVYQTVTRFKNNLIFGYTQMMAENENGNIMEYYRGKNGMFRRDTPNNIKERLDSLIERFPFLRNNYLIANLYTADVTNSVSDKEIVFLLKNIDVDESSAEFNDAFEEGLNHNQPEIKQFFNDIALGTFIQSGPHYVSGGLINIVPPSVYSKYTNDAFAKLQDMKENNPELFDRYLALTRYNTHYTKFYNKVISLVPSFVINNYADALNQRPAEDYFRKENNKVIRYALFVERQLKGIVPLAQPVVSQTSEQIYPQLGKKTVSTNIVISNIKTKDGKYDRDANLKEAKANGRIYSMEVDSNEKSFSNPWASFDRKGTIKTNTTKEAVENYIDWLITDKFKDVNPQRREWILGILKSGQLKGRQIQYYAELNEPSHATALNYLINKYDWNQPSTQAPVSAQPIVTDIKAEDITFKSNKLETFERAEGLEPVKGYGLKINGQPNVDLFTYRDGKEWVVIDNKSKRKLPLRDTFSGNSPTKAEIVGLLSDTLTYYAKQEKIRKVLEEVGFNFTQPTQPTVSGTNNPAEYTNHSGGAKGYDAEWDLIGAEFGMVNNRHYLLPSDGAVADTRLQAKGVKPVDATNDVGPVALEGPATGEAQIAVTNAERAMGRIEPNHTTRNTKKIRNYAQVKNADGIFAIGSLIPKGADITVARGQATKKALVPQVNGGTSVAVQLGITMGKPTYVFNQVANDTYPQGWYKWDNTKQDFVSVNTPVLTKNFAGIGTSSNTTEAGKQAIRDVYANTFKTTQAPNTPTQSDIDKLTDINPC